MSESHANRVFRLLRRPEGELADGDLELVEEPMPDLEPGQALVRTKLLSLDARKAMTAAASCSRSIRQTGSG